MLQMIVWGITPAMMLLCIFASIRFYLRLRMDAGPTRWVWLSLMSLIGGGVGWAAHYITITNFPPGDDLFWSMPYLAFSFLIGVSCLGLSVKIAEQSNKEWYTIVFMLVFSSLVSAGNIGMIVSAKSQGAVAFDLRYAVVSTLIGFALGYVGANITRRAVTLKKGLIGAAALAVLSPIQDMINLSGVRVIHDPMAPIPPGFAPDMVMFVMLVSCAVVALLVGTAGLMIDRTLEREASKRYRVLATTDALTALHNRTGFNEALAPLLHCTRQNNARLLVAAIDLDKFKPINDLYGHATGDEVLVAVADRLRALGDDDVIFGRLGGDEFIAAKALLPGADHLAEAQAFARSLLHVIRAPIPHADKEIGVDASVGLSLMPQHGTDGPTLINAADIALYRVKARRDGFALYDNQMGKENLRRAQLEVEIANALKSNEFVLYFQPQVNLISGEPTGYEALIRWKHPERGLIMPGEFIPIAESSSLISDIGAWVLADACRTAATWPPSYSVAVNVAVRQLSQPNFIDTVQAALTAADLPAQRLEIELTEASVIEDQAQALKVMHQLRALGVRLAMDDYGTGYASLAALRTFPFDKLKIDRSFISGVEEDKQLAAIVKSTLFLTRALSIPVVAEGVESRHHVEFLAREGCEDVQGYFYGRPMPAEAVAAQIAKTERTSHAS